MYKIIPQNIPQARRAEVNEKILFCIDTGSDAIPAENIYNCYTGIGGLHNLNKDDYQNYAEYSRAKKEYEMGQFFTPHTLCRDMVDLLGPSPEETVLDMCCGMGNFFNFLPNHHNAFGFDIDSRAVAVARHLYPDANVTASDIVQYDPGQRFDTIIGNPPYNLKIDGELSQSYYIRKAGALLNPAGLLMIVVPHSFLEKESWEKSRITAINRDFSFIGQSDLDPNAFAAVGVHNFKTKVMVFLRKSRHIQMTPYREDDFVSWEVLGERIAQWKELKKSLRVKLSQEKTSIEKEELERFEYKVAKYLFELKAHANLRKHHQKAIALVAKFRSQQPPEKCTNEQYKEWEKNKLTTQKVQAILRRYIRNQYVVPRREIALVKTSYGFKVKSYGPRIPATVSQRYFPMNGLVLGIDHIHLALEKSLCPGYGQQLRIAEKLIRRKKREYENQSRRYADMEPDPALRAYLAEATFINKKWETCHFTELQKSDMNLVMQKRYNLLNWQQGSGKTAAVYHYARYLMKKGRVRNTVVLAPAIATNLTWEKFLSQNGERYRVLHRLSDIEKVRDGEFVVCSISMLDKFKRHLYRFMKMRSQKVCLVFDESDEITNPTAARTVATLAAFRRARYKVLATGTTTRNNINELYSQLELLYNNSINMICWCHNVYTETRDGEIIEEGNQMYGMPFPAFRGHVLFKHCHCPGRTSVFGIEKQNQDIYNKNHLYDLIAKTIITRKFREFAGEKYRIVTHSVNPSDGEFKVYRVIMDEFCRICELFYNSTGDARKDAQLKIMRQIKLLIRACSTPNIFPKYFGPEYPTKTSDIGNLMLNEMPGKVAIGCTELKTLDMYKRYLEEHFPDRPLFIIKGDVGFSRREKIIARFEDTLNGILLCTQQSLKSSANIPTCNSVILETLQWNIPKMEQFFFRFIRLDSTDMTDVHFVTYADSIEQNLMALVLTKERLNEFIKSGEVMEQSEIFDEFNVVMSVVESMLIRTKDNEGRFHISWGSQRIAA